MEIYPEQLTETKIENIKKTSWRNYSFPGVFLDVNGKDVRFHESEKVLDAHFRFLIFFLLGFLRICLLYFSFYSFFFSSLE